MNPYSLAVLLSVASATSACDPLDRLEGKSPGRDHAERMALLTTPAAEPDPAPAPVEPECRLNPLDGTMTCN